MKIDDLDEFKDLFTYGEQNHQKCATCNIDVDLEIDNYYFFEPNLSVYCEKCCKEFGAEPNSQ